MAFFTACPTKPITLDGFAPAGTMVFRIPIHFLENDRRFRGMMMQVSVRNQGPEYGNSVSFFTVLSHICDCHFCVRGLLATAFITQAMDVTILKLKPDIVVWPFSGSAVSPMIKLCDFSHCATVKSSKTKGLTCASAASEGEKA